MCSIGNRLIKYYLNKVKSLCDEEDLADLANALASLIATTPLSDQDQDLIFESLFPEDKPWSEDHKTSFIIASINKLDEEHRDTIKSILDWTELKPNECSENTGTEIEGIDWQDQQQPNQ